GHRGRHGAISLAKVARGVYAESARVTRALFGLKGGDALEGPLEDLGHVPALKTGVGIDLRAMVHLVLEHHHEQAPARQGTGVSIISIRRVSHAAGVSRSSAAKRSADDWSHGSHVCWSARSTSAGENSQPSPR